MADITKMTLDEMIDAGLTSGQIQAALNSRIASREKELEKQRAAEAATKAKQEEIMSARRQYKKAHIKYMEAITGAKLTDADIAEFDGLMDAIEQEWNTKYAPSAKRTIKVNGKELSSDDELAQLILKILG